MLESQSNPRQSFTRSGGSKDGGPKGEGPKGGASSGGSGRWGAHFLLPSGNFTLSSLSGVCSWNFGGVFEAPGPEVCAFWPLCELRRPHDNQKAQTCTFERPGLRKNYQNSTRKPPEREEKVKFPMGEGKKKARNFGRSGGGAIRRGRRGTQNGKRRGPNFVSFWAFSCCGKSIFGAFQRGTPTRAKHVDKKKGNINKSKTENTAKTQQKCSKTQQTTANSAKLTQTHTQTHTQHTPNPQPTTKQPSTNHQPTTTHTHENLDHTQCKGYISHTRKWLRRKQQLQHER